MKHVIVDLDGTLALIEHRRHLVSGGNHNWKEFNQQCVNDSPNWPVIGVVMALFYARHKINIFSGRNEVVQLKTKQWLAKYGIPYHRLIMRPDHGPLAHIADQELKRGWLHELFPNKEEILCVIDDRQKVVDMWREEGLACLQVAPGDFDEIKVKV